MAEIAANRVDLMQKVTQVHDSNGHYAVHGWTFEAAANAETAFDISFPYTIDLLEARCQSESDHTGDSITVLIAPDTTVCALAANASASDTTVTVSDTSNLRLGYWLQVGAEPTPYPRITSIDSVTNQVTLGQISWTNGPTYSGLSQGYSASGPTYCQISVPMITQIPLVGGRDITLGNSILNTSSLQANTVLRIRYTNVHASNAHTVRFFVEYLY